MRTLDFPFEAINSFTFTRRPVPLNAGLRPVYRFALIVLVLKINCRNNTGSLLQIQFFNWVLNNPALQKTLQNIEKNSYVFTLDLIHLDPMVNLALRYAVADHLIFITGSNKYKLTNKGEEFAVRILKNKENVLLEELKLLSQIGKRISDVRLRNELA